MSVLEILHKRRSVRGFVYQPIADADWQEILEAGRIAATSRNKQARRFVTILEPSRIKELVHEAKMQEFLTDTSALVVGCATDINSSGADVFISLAQMEMVAVSKGIGTLWLGVFDRDVLAKRINLPEGLKVVCMMAFGYPAAPGHMPTKLPLEELFFTNSF